MNATPFAGDRALESDKMLIIGTLCSWRRHNGCVRISETVVFTRSLSASLEVLSDNTCSTTRDVIRVQCSTHYLLCNQASFCRHKQKKWAQFMYIVCFLIGSRIDHRCVSSLLSRLSVVTDFILISRIPL